MGLKNLLTGILLAGSTFVYGQNSSENHKKISDLYGEKGEKIVYKDYSKIPWEQIDSNEINIGEIFTNKDEMGLKLSEENKATLEDTVFAEVYKLGYKKEDIKNLEAKKAVDLIVNIVALRYEYDSSSVNEYTYDAHGNYYKSYDYSFFRKLGICVDYSRAFVGVFDLIKKENKNLKNIYPKMVKGLGHMWNQLIFLTKDSMFISDVDITLYDLKEIEMLGVNYFDSEIDSKINALNAIRYIKGDEKDEELLNNLYLERKKGK